MCFRHHFRHYESPGRASDQHHYRPSRRQLGSGSKCEARLLFHVRCGWSDASYLDLERSLVIRNHLSLFQRGNSHTYRVEGLPLYRAMLAEMNNDWLRCFIPGIDSAISPNSTRGLMAQSGTPGIKKSR